MHLLLYWLADLCAEYEIHFVLAHALYLKAIHRGKLKNDRIDSEMLATLQRGGAFLMSYVYPAKCARSATSGSVITRGQWVRPGYALSGSNSRRILRYYAVGQQVSKIRRIPRTGHEIRSDSRLSCRGRAVPGSASFPGQRRALCGSRRGLPGPGGGGMRAEGAL